MASTPEGKVKAKVKALIKKYGGWQHWPVQTGYGSPTLDCHAVVGGHSLHIETKAPGKKPTERQWMTIKAISAAGGVVLVVDGTDDYAKLMLVLDWMRDHPTPLAKGMIGKDRLW